MCFSFIQGNYLLSEMLNACFETIHQNALRDTRIGSGASKKVNDRLLVVQLRKIAPLASSQVR